MACTFIAMISGTLVTRVKLPPFIVTLGMLAVMTAVTNLYSAGTTYPVPEGLLTFLGTSLYLFGRIQFTMGMILAVILFVVMWFILSKTGWGRHVYAVGNEPEAARLTGINIDKTLVSVYAVAGLIYGFAAWMALGRTPTADPNAYQTGNLDSITAVVIGGTSLFGGRGGVVGTVVGALIVAVLRSGLTQMGIDSNYQNLATGVLVIAAVAFDQDTRRRLMSTATEKTTGRPAAAAREPMLTGRGLVKRYGNVTAINGADFDLFPGEVLAIVGDNGAGKSSLIKALTGAVIPDSGEITLDGEQVTFHSPVDARNDGHRDRLPDPGRGAGPGHRDATCSSGGRCAARASSASCACWTRRRCARAPVTS